MLNNGFMWAILGMVLLLIELFLPGVYALWIGIAAIFTALIAFVAPGLDVWLLLVFAVLSTPFDLYELLRSALTTQSLP